ncbi:MAG: response regulator transcription factor [Pyrinomonadaceae bacterium]|nr:response regulator transcription factor [Pyrinomonadaceae bacterium]
MKEIKVFIADDHPVFLSGLQMILETDKQLKVIGASESGKEAIEEIENLKPDVAVLDLGMPDANGFEVVRALQEKEMEMNFIFLTMHDEEATLNSALDLGVKGYILKDTAISEIISAIKLVAKGKNYITPKLSTYLINRNQSPKSFLPNFEKITLTEMKILNLIAEHKTTKEIAKELFVSRRTVDRHRYNICVKLNIRGINSLVKFAIENKSKFNLN